MNWSQRISLLLSQAGGRATCVVVIIVKTTAKQHWYVAGSIYAICVETCGGTSTILPQLSPSAKCWRQATNVVAFRSIALARIEEKAGVNYFAPPIPEHSPEDFHEK